MAAAAADYEDDEEEGYEYEEVEFPAELDEFLECCVEEHGEDFEAISKDFLEIAKELEAPLVGRAHEFFSPESLRERWQYLCECYEGGEEDDQGQVETTSPATASEGKAAASASSAAAKPAQAAAAAAAAPDSAAALDEVNPSGFSIFKDSLKSKIDKIYDDLQTKLPSTVGMEDGSSDESEEEPSESAAPAAAQRPTGEGAVLPDTVAPPTESAAVAGLSGPEAALGDAIGADDLRDRTRELFGTDNINEAFAQANDSGGLANIPGAGHISSEIASFEAVLVSHGVNPNDITGPELELPDDVKGLFGKLKETLTRGHEAAAAERQAAAPQTAKPAAKAAAPKPSAKPAFAPPPRVAPPPADESDGSGSGDSADEDFSKIRQKLKNKSATFVSKKEEDGAVPTTRPAFVPVQRPAPKAPPKKYVKLQLIESSDEGSDTEKGSDDDEADEETQAATADNPDTEVSKDGKEDDGRDAAELAVDFEPIRVMSWLLDRAPEGECAWDVWLEAIRRYPKLQVALGSPEFCRRGAKRELLCVLFDAAKLKELLESEREEREERKRQQEERRERFKLGVADFVRETERRRELLGGRLGAGFVLASSRPELEAQHARTRQKKIDEREEEERKQALLAEEAQRLREEEERRKEREAKREAAKKEAADRAAAELEAKKRKEEEARLRAARLEALQEDISKKLCPLYDKHISHGMELQNVSFSMSRKTTEDGAGKHLHAYLLPWGTADVGHLAVTQEQVQALSALHDSGLCEGVLLLSSRELRGHALVSGVSGAKALEAIETSQAVVVLLLAAEGCQRNGSALDVKIGGSLKVRDLLVGPVTPDPAVELLGRPLALWSAEVDMPQGQAAALLPASVSLNDDSRAASEHGAVETVCVVLGTRSGGVQEGALGAVLQEAQAEGLMIAGIRLIFPGPSAADSVHSASLRASLRVGGPVLAVALRAPHALAIWRRVLGPADPELARRTDPDSINARYGGIRRTEAVSGTPASTASKAFADVIWAFGGRVDDNSPESPCAPRPAVHALLSLPLRPYGLRLSGLLTFENAGEVLAALAMRAGRILDMQADAGEAAADSAAADASPALVVTAVREGGGAFVEKCSRLLWSPLEMTDDARPSSPLARPGSIRLEGQSLHARASAVPSRCCMLSAPSSTGTLSPHELHGAADSPTSDSLVQLSEPEVLVLGLRPHAVTPSILRAALDGLHTKFSLHGTSSLPGLSVGLGVDLLAVRLLDFHAVSTAARGASDLLHTAQDVLREFRGFQYLAQRSGDPSQEEWWAGTGPVGLVALRGEDLLNRFKNFLLREWQLPAATAGDILFTPSASIARFAWRTFFGARYSAAFSPTWPPSDLRSGLRFTTASPEAEVKAFSELSLFPTRQTRQVTVAVLIPPSVDALLFRLLTAIEQQGFTLHAAVIAGGLSDGLAKTLFEQEVADGHLAAAEWPDFKESVGCSREEESAEENTFRCLWVVVSRHQAVKRLSQLCSHGDPAVNKRHFHACLRLGRDHMHNGIRCATSCSSANRMLAALSNELQPALRPASEDAAGERCLGVEASSICALECTLIAGAIVETSEVSAAHFLRQLHTALGEQGLVMIGLRLMSLADASAEDNSPASVASSTWPEGDREEAAAQLRRWQALRPKAERLCELALKPDCAATFVILACEGPLATGSAAQALASCRPKVGADLFEGYASPSTAEGAVDVAHFFHELFGGRHYVV
eukprot:TRINITY_DN6992_c0_g5_i1.p1 TRINITY_DN6992_c0_g5~~TRINITY_DN6992_c0_g5_i1.p1  ORF type:complete len:1721 (+),score=462.82 TRINITY_DN6992_c0_g5_i1:53-5215(+)